MPRLQPRQGLFPPDPRAHRTVDKAHGRLEVREIRLFEDSLADYVRTELCFPHVSQTYRITRIVTRMKTGKTSIETVYGITSHTPASSTAADLLAWHRGHWGIENTLHWCRDVTFGEDKSSLRTGHAPQNMAAFRNLAIGLLSLIVRTLAPKTDFPTIMRDMSRNWRTVFSILGL